MAAAAATPVFSAVTPVRDPAPELAFGERVRTPEGEAGRVAGFYRTGTPTVLIRLDSGREHQYPRGELITAPRRRDGDATVPNAHAA
jgi:hypothetical protein